MARERTDRWWRGALAASAALAAGCGLMPPEKPSAQAPQAAALPPAGYELVWEDEFEGSTLDASKWTAAVGPRREYVMTPGAAQVAGGLLTIRTYTDAGGTHHSAFLSTEGHFEAALGYFEARIKFEDSPGEWCAFWIYSPTNGDPMGDPAAAGVEIDVVEHRVTDQGGWTALRDMSAMNLNWDGYGANMKNEQKVAGLPGSAPIQETWRTFGVLWTSTGYAFFVDGIELWSSPDAVSRRPETIQLTCEVQDQSWAGDVPTGGYGSLETSTTGMQVDWVRVWQLPGS